MSVGFSILVVLFAALVVCTVYVSGVISRITRIPQLIFYLLVGLIVGPVGLGLVTLQLLVWDPVTTSFILTLEGELLKIVVGLAVAIIIFEGGYSFNLRRFRPLLGGITRLSLIGGIITWVLMTLLFLYVAYFPIGVAMLCGVLCGITGPTVIQPIVQQLGIKEEVGGTLEGEGLLNDALSVIIVAVIFGAILEGGFGSIIAFPLQVAFNLGLGVLTGLAVGGLGILISRAIAPTFTRRFQNHFNSDILGQLSRVGVLIAAFLAYGLGEVVAIEAGIVSALLAGILIGNRHAFGSTKEHSEVEPSVHSFQMDLTKIAIATVFILLATMISLEAITNILLGNYLIYGVPPIPFAGLILVVALILVVRPLSVLVATLGTQFTLRERLFMSFLGPRGIVIASTGLFLTIELLIDFSAHGHLIIPGLLPGYIFLIVLTTVVLEGGLAPLTARLFGVSRS
ncbi:MAG: cation:proton antiporter [Promethearchaeota archaeon]